MGNVLQNTIQGAIMELMNQQPKVVMSWGTHKAALIEDGIKFNVQGFKFEGEVKIKFDYLRSYHNDGIYFKVLIGDTLSTGIEASELIRFIDEQVELVDNYEEAVKNSMTPEVYEFAKNADSVIIF